MTKAEFAVLLALGAALASALGGVVRQRSAKEVTDEPVGTLALFRLSLKDHLWWLGAVGAIANYVLQAAALALGSVMLVSALQVTALLFALPIYARTSHHRVTGRQWMWAVLLAGAVAAVLCFGDPTAGQSRAPVHTWWVVAAVMAPVLVLCVLAARIWSGAVAAVLLAFVSGSLMALFSVLTKGVVKLLERGPVTALHTPLLYGWLAIAVLGMVFQQSAFRAGSLSASFPTMTVAKPVVAWLLGIIVLGERLHPGDETMVVVVAGMVLTIVATAALARGEAAAADAGAETEQRRADQPTGAPTR